MSDTRNDAEQEMVNAGMASGLEDSLGSSLSGSFAPPPLQPKPAPPPSAAAEVAKAEEAEESGPPVPGMAEWKDTYDKYLEDWQAESHLTRAKAEEVRKKIEDEHAAVAKAKSDDAKAKKKADADAKKQKEREEKLKRELEQVGSSSSTGSARRKIEQGREERERKVKEAWEMVKGAGERKQDKEVVTDGRGVTDADIKAGQAHVVGQDKPEAKSTGYDPTTSKDPLPPSLQDQPPSPTLPMPSSSQTLSRHSATSQAWTEVSANTSSAEDLSPARSGSSDDALEQQQQHQQRGKASVPASAPAPQNPTNHAQPPAQPPSLTLSLFTSPSTVSVSKVFAIVGINIVLPFINGIMLGFGEIFAREVVRTGRSWWNAGFGVLGGRGAGGRGTSGVGLSGSRGF